MASYTYKCLNCGERFDIKASIQEKEEAKSEKFVCPHCGSKNIKQKFSAANLLLNAVKGENRSGDCCSSDQDCGCNSQANQKEENCCGDDHGKGCC